MTRLINFRLILFIALSFCVGIVSAYFLVCDKIFWSVFLLSLFIILNLLFIFPFSSSAKRKANIIYSLIFLVVFFFGNLSFFVSVNNYENADLGNHYYQISGKVVDVYETAYGNKYVIKNASIKGNISGRLTNKIALYINGSSAYDIGDIISFSTYLEDKPLFYEGRFNANDIAQRIKYTASVSSDQVTYIENNKTIFEKINVGIRETLKKGLGEKQFPIAYALLTGNSEYMDVDVLYSYRSAGVAHIFAVSGLHVGFVAMALNFLFDKFRQNKLIKAVAVTVVLILFSGVCGFTASSLRATVMSSVLLFSAIGGHKYDKYTSVALAGLIVLLISPIQLLCAGFQLSFIIVLGMFLLMKPLSKLLKFLPKKIATSLSSVISAQLSAIPASLAIFGQFSLIAVMTNLLLIPIVGAIFIALIVAVIISLIFGAHSFWFFLPDQALKVINAIITAVDYQAFIVGGIFMGGFIVFYYLTIILSSDIINLKRLARISVASITALTFLVGTIAYTNYQQNRVRAYICGSETICATVISTPTERVLIISDSNHKFYTSRLNRIANAVGRDISTVVVTGGFDCDIQVLTTQLREVFNLQQICYYGQRLEDLELAVMKSFPEISINNYVDGKSFSSDSVAFNFLINGNAVEVSVADKTMLIFSAFEKDNADYSLIDGHYDYTVYLDLAESLSQLINTEHSLCYRRNLGFNDAESGGNAIVLLA